MSSCAKKGDNLPVIEKYGKGYFTHHRNPGMTAAVFGNAQNLNFSCEATRVY
jgi:hypothetical protein